MNQTATRSNQDNGPISPPLQKSGRAVTGADRIKPVKTSIIFGLGRWLQINVMTMCAELYLCRPTELSRASGDEFIAYLGRLRPPQVAD